MSNYIKKAAAHARLLKLASAARLIRRQRALQKYAQAVQMQKQALSSGAATAIGAGLGGLVGGGIGYGVGGKKRKLLSTLIGAGAGAGIGAGGTALFNYLTKKRVNPVDAQAIADALSPEVALPGYKSDTLAPPTVSAIPSLLSPATVIPTTPPAGGYSATGVTNPQAVLGAQLASQGEAVSGVHPIPHFSSSYEPDSESLTAGAQFTPGALSSGSTIKVPVPESPVLY